MKYTSPSLSAADQEDPEVGEGSEAMSLCPKLRILSFLQILVNNRLAQKKEEVVGINCGKKQKLLCMLV